MNLLKAVERVLKNGQFILGEEGKAFEREVAEYYNKKYAIGVNSGTDALIIAIDACFKLREREKKLIRRGVITTPYTFVASAEAIVRANGMPAFADIDEDDFLIDPEDIRRKIEKRPHFFAGIVPVHLFGTACDMEEIMSIAKEHDLFVVEDAAQAFGNKLIGQGDCLCFSFHPSKTLGGCGDGGIILTNNKKLADICRSLRNHGSDLSMGPEGKYHNLYTGYNSRLDEIQAAILREKLKNFKPPYKRLYTFKTPNRDLVKKFLDDNGIDNKIYYSKLLHTQPAFAFMEEYGDSFPVAEKVAKECLTINIYEENLNHKSTSRRWPIGNGGKYSKVCTGRGRNKVCYIVMGGTGIQQRRNKKRSS